GALPSPGLPSCLVMAEAVGSGCCSVAVAFGSAGAVLVAVLAALPAARASAAAVLPLVVVLLFMRVRPRGWAASLSGGPSTVAGPGSPPGDGLRRDGVLDEIAGVVRHDDFAHRLTNAHAGGAAQAGDRLGDAARHAALPLGGETEGHALAGVGQRVDVQERRMVAPGARARGGLAGLGGVHEASAYQHAVDFQHVGERLA